VLEACFVHLCRRTGRSASRTPVPPRSCGPSRPGATHPQASAAPARRSSKIS